MCVNKDNEHELITYKEENNQLALDSTFNGHNDNEALLLLTRREVRIILQVVQYKEK